jgi:hypothetical protein
MRLGATRRQWPWVGHLFRDVIYDRTRLLDKAAFLDPVIEILRLIEREPSRSIVESFVAAGLRDELQLVEFRFIARSGRRVAPRNGGLIKLALQ